MPRPRAVAALSLPRTWIVEHALLALHVWILHNRFKVDYNVSGDFSGRRMQEQLFERLWEDTTMRIRNAGVAEMSVNKQLELVQKGSFDEMFAYDAAIKVDDDDNMELAAAVWKCVWTHGARGRRAAPHARALACVAQGRVPRGGGRQHGGGAAAGGLRAS